MRQAQVIDKVKAVSTYMNKKNPNTPTWNQMMPHGAHSVSHDLHVPAPGRVQYYRAEALPFVPDEIKT